MLRIYTNVKNIDSPNNILKRYDGGDWFSEEYEDGERKSYNVFQRNALSDSETILEFLEELDDNFMQLPCWLDEVQAHHPYSGWSVLSFPLPWPPSSLYLPQPLCFLRSEIEEIVKTYTAYEAPTSLDQSSLSQHRMQDPKRLVKSPLQNSMQFQPSSEIQPSYPREEQQQEGSVPTQLTVLPNAFSAVPKGVQVGLLCSPINLPDEQSPRKSTRRPKEQRKPLSQVRPKLSNQCLIDLSVS
jgi:hypothetical protein